MGWLQVVTLTSEYLLLAHYSFTTLTLWATWCSAAHSVAFVQLFRIFSTLPPHMDCVTLWKINLNGYKCVRNCVSVCKISMFFMCFVTVSLCLFKWFLLNCNLFIYNVAGTMDLDIFNNCIQCAPLEDITMSIILHYWILCIQFV